MAVNTLVAEVRAVEPRGSVRPQMPASYIQQVNVLKVEFDEDEDTAQSSSNGVK